MDFVDAINRLSKKIEEQKENLLTEEATKNALIMPFIMALGYDVFNPTEVVPEMICDIGKKKGEKIDYAILCDKKPLIIIECKHWGENLDNHLEQLTRYYLSSTEIKFGILTNGIEYRFYSDLVKPNVMDSKPFFVINLTTIKETEIEELRKFHKQSFDICEITGSANSLKYTRELKEIIAKEFTQPSEEFVRFFCKDKHAYDGKTTASVITQFTPLVKKSIASYIQDIITLRLNAAIQSEGDKSQDSNDEEIPELEIDQKHSKINTTEEEIEGFHIIKSILRQTVDVNRITYRDTQSYFGIFVDNNRLKTICRLYVESKMSKKLCIIDDDKNKISYPLETVDDIYKYADELIASVSRFIED